MSSEPLASSKRSASVAGMDTSAETSGSKRPRVKNIIKNTTSALAVQNGIYAAEKFSDSFTISHVLNLLVESECVGYFCGYAR